VTELAETVTGVCEWAKTLHPYSPELQEDPYPHYARLRAECPIARSEESGGFWILSKYDDIHFVLQHHEIFSSVQITVDPMSFTPLGQDIPTQVDPPEHTRYRTLMNPWFSPRAIEAMEDTIRAAALELLEPMVGRSEWDFMADFAAPFPSGIFLELMGLPPEDLPRFTDWKRLILHAKSPEELSLAYSTVKVDLMEYFRAIYRERQGRVSPGEDLIGSLIAAQVGGERPLDESEFIRTACLMWGAGLDTVESQLGLSMHYLSQHPDKRDMLVAKPELIPFAIEELMRYESLVAECRKATQDVMIRGTQIRAGDVVWMLFGSAGRDEDYTPNPDEVDFERAGVRHFGFGGGVHRCVGSKLARAEMRIALEEIHRLLPNYRIDETKPARRHGGYTRGVDALHLRID